MQYLLDTNIISEIIKKRSNLYVKQWFKDRYETDLYLSVITINELYYGFYRNKSNLEHINMWIENLINRFSDRIINIDIVIAKKTAEFMVGSLNKNQDSYIAATAYVNNLSLVTRNIKDFNNFNINLINPFDN